MSPAVIAFIMWILSYLLARKNGMSSTKAALAATGVAAGSYYLAGGTFGGYVNPVSPGVSSAVKGAFSTTGEVLTSGAQWISKNPGTAALIGGTVGLTSKSDTIKKWLIFGSLGFLAIFLMKDDKVEN